MRLSSFFVLIQVTSKPSTFINLTLTLIYLLDMTCINSSFIFYLDEGEGEGDDASSSVAPFYS